MNIRNKSKYILLTLLTFGIVSTGFTGCSDAPDEITELNLARYQKVMNVTVNVMEGTQVRLNWDEDKKADGYVVEFFADDEDMTFAGEPFYTIDHIENDDLPYRLLTGLEGNTTYSVRVKATGNEADDSKWSDGVTVTTGGEQLFYSMNSEEITHESATVRWIAGEIVTHLLVSGGDWINTQITLSQTNITEGMYELTGLYSETTYTVRLMNGEKQRGEVSFTTTVNLQDVIAVTENDDLQEMIDAGDPGSRFYLLGETFDFGTINVTKSTTILSNGNTVVTAKFNFTGAGSSLTLQNLILDGNETLDATFIYETAGDFGPLTVEDCVIRNYTTRLISSTTGNITVVSSVVIDNCIISDIAGSGSDFIDFRTSKVPELTITNTTFFNIYPTVNRDFIRLDNTGTDIQKTIVISNCTFDNVVAAGNRMFYVRGLNDITFSNNMVTNTNAVFRNQSATTISSLQNNNYYNAPNLTAGSSGNHTYDTAGSTFNPEYANSAAGDFTVTNEDVKYDGIGDPRWIP